MAAVLGDPIAHSRSPTLLGAAFGAAGVDAVMVPLRVTLADVAQVVPALAKAGVFGASVTAPLKQAVIAACGELTPRARRAGAVNCLDFAGGTIVGDCTDGAGLLADLVARGVEVRGRRALVLGAGGAARAVETHLADAGASTRVVARDPTRADWLPPAQVVSWTDLREALPSCDLLIDATSAALDERTDTLAVPCATMPPDAVVVSLVYHRRAALLTDAERAGRRAIDGAGMLVHQAALAFERWLGHPAPLDAMWPAL